MCSMHSARLSRTGTTDKIKRGLGKYTNADGYVFIYRPEHPLSRAKDGFVREHRAALYDKLDGSTPVCHWCHAALSWETCRADHLDENTSNNDPHNIVPACNICNLKRGKARALETYKQRHGARIQVDGQSYILVDVAKEHGISTEAIRQRLKMGWTGKRVFSQPTRIYRKSSDV